jgi:hypothetical protein
MWSRQLVLLCVCLPACWISPDPDLWKQPVGVDQKLPGDSRHDNDSVSTGDLATGQDRSAGVDQAKGAPGPFGQGKWLLDTPQPLDLDGSNVHFVPDGLAVYFNSQRAGGAGGSDIYHATWSPSSGTFGTATNLSSLNTAAHEDSFSVSGDGLSAVLVSSQGGQVDVWIGQRSSTSDPWATSMFTVDQKVSTPDSDYDAILTADGLRVYVASLGSAAQKIVVAERPSPTAPFGARQLLEGGINSSSAADPALTVDERVIVFLWYAVRTGATSFSAPQPLPAPVNTAENEREPEISPDGTRLFWIRDNTGLMHSKILSGP